MMTKNDKNDTFMTLFFENVIAVSLALQGFAGFYDKMTKFFILIIEKIKYIKEYREKSVILSSDEI